MWTAGHMNIDILNAYCGLYWQVSLPKLYRPHMVEGCIIIYKLNFCVYCNVEVLLRFSVVTSFEIIFCRKAKCTFTSLRMFNLYMIQR